MKKTLFLTVILLMSINAFGVSAGFDETIVEDKIYRSEVIPNEMGSGSVIEYVSDSYFIIKKGEIVQGYNKNIFNTVKKTPGVVYEEYPDPVKGLVVTYADDGYILDLIYPDHIENPLLVDSQRVSQSYINNNIRVNSRSIGGFRCDSYTLLAQWGGYPNKLYNCTSILPICPTSTEDVGKPEIDYQSNCSTTVYSRVGTGRATTFSDSIGQANIKLKKGDVATKLAHDNVAVGKVISVNTKNKSGVSKTVNMTKNDAGGMPNAVLDIWKTGVEYWGYNWSSTFSMPHQTNYQYRR